METKLPLPLVDVAERSDPGRDPDKQVNEDACGHKETRFGHLCVLCDGMGGHQNGREASTLAVRTILETFDAAPASVPGGPVSGSQERELLAQAIVLANRRVFELGGAITHGRPGSTVVALLLHAGGAEIAHVGDSRCYMIQDGQIFQLTKDHSMVQKLVDAKVLTPEQAAVHPDANQILRALGSAAEVEVEVRAQTVPLAPGSAFVLCSDGLCDLVDQAQILDVASSLPPAQAASRLVDLANERGGHDNITVMIVRGRDAGAPSSGGSGPRIPRHGVAPTIPQTLVDVPAFVPPIAAPAAPSAAPSSPHAPPATGSAPTLPFEMPPANLARMAPPGARPPATAPPQKRRFPVAMAVGIVLAVIGIGAAAFVIYLLLNPTSNAKQVPPFAVTGVPIASSRTPVTLVPAVPEPDPQASPTADSGSAPAPLPSLVPSPPHHRRGL
jgi:protein phosphatase